MKKTQAFTLVELIVGVTISMILMVSVWAILSSWVENILKQEKIISNTQNFWESIEQIYENFENIENTYIFSTQSGSLFKSKNYFQKIGFWYLGVINQSDSYCPLESEVTQTQHLSWNFFFPYEEIWEDFLNNFSDISTAESWNYTVDTLSHQVKENGNIIMWKNNFWYDFAQWDDGTNIWLNTPTGIVEAEWWFFLSDTWNHRVLFYKDGKTYLIADRHDGLEQPSWLAYSGSTLYIANSWKWEILTFSAQQYSQNPPLEIQFQPDRDYGSIDRFELIFTWASFNPDINISKDDFWFDEINFKKNEDYFQLDNNILKYYFSDFNSTRADIVNWPISGCTDGVEYSVDSNSKVQKIETTCTSTATWSRNISTGTNSYTLWQTNQYEITLDNITPNITQEGNYLTKVDFYSENNLVYSKLFPYFTQSTWKISDYDYNTLEVFVDGLKMPTWISISWNWLQINDSLARKIYNYDISTKTQSSDSNMTDFSENGLKNIIFNPLTDIIIENPIKSLNFNYDTNNKYLWAYIQYYHYLNCYNPEEFIEKEMIFWKKLDN